MSARDAIFWDRLLEMPHVEAIAELQARKIDAMEERAAATEAGDVFTEKAADRLMAALNVEIKRRNIMHDKTNWQRAVRALYGEEGWKACRLWMVAQDPLA